MVSRVRTEGLKAMGPKNALPRSRSTDAIDRLSHGLQKAMLHCKPLQQLQSVRPVSRKGPSVPDNLRGNVSRLELLLGPNENKKVFKPAGHCEASQALNRAIKLAAQWTDVQRAVGPDASLSPGNAAFAVYRLGCLASFASKKRNADLAASGLVPTLVGVAIADLQALDAGSLTLLLDGCARLGHCPSADVLEGVATAVEGCVGSMDGSQVSLVLWALERLGFAPKKKFFVAFDNAVEGLAATMTPQAICLTLRGFQTGGHRPNTRTLTLLSEGLQRQLPLFKPSEIATCLEAFSAFAFQPAGAVVDAIKQQTGQPLHANESAGKRPLGAPRVAPKPVDGTIVRRPRKPNQTPVDPMAAAGKLVRRASEELQQSLSPRGADWDAVRLG